LYWQIRFHLSFPISFFFQGPSRPVCASTSYPAFYVLSPAPMDKGFWTFSPFHEVPLQITPGPLFFPNPIPSPFFRTPVLRTSSDSQPPEVHPHSFLWYFILVIDPPTFFFTPPFPPRSSPPPNSFQICPLPPFPHPTPPKFPIFVPFSPRIKFMIPPHHITGCTLVPPSHSPFSLCHLKFCHSHISPCLERFHPKTSPPPLLSPILPLLASPSAVCPVPASPVRSKFLSDHPQKSQTSSLFWNAFFSPLPKNVLSLSYLKPPSGLPTPSLPFPPLSLVFSRIPSPLYFGHEGHYLNPCNPPLFSFF